MRKLTLLFTTALLTPLVATAQTAPAPTATPAAAKPHYSTADTDIGTLLDNPATKAILMKEIPQIAGNDGIAQARGMTLKAIQPYTGDALSDATLAKIDAELADVKAKN